LPFPIDLLRRTYNSERSAVRHCDKFLTLITGSTVAVHCGKAHVQIQWEMAFWPPCHQNPWNVSNLNLTSMITSPRSTPVQIFISIHSAGTSPT